MKIVLEIGFINPPPQVHFLRRGDSFHCRIFEQSESRIPTRVWELVVSSSWVCAVEELDPDQILGSWSSHGVSWSLQQISLEVALVSKVIGGALHPPGVLINYTYF